MTTMTNLLYTHYRTPLIKQDSHGMQIFYISLIANHVICTDMQENQSANP